MTTPADEFEALRPHLLAVAYRLTGTFADAEDTVQDAWLRWHCLGGRRADIVELRAWLTTVVGRLGLDRMRSAARRRETYIGQRLPEPAVTALAGKDVVDEVMAHEDAGFAATVVLEKLCPDQRVAFVLREGFGVSSADIADVLGTTPAAARKLASRARLKVLESPSPQRDPLRDKIVVRLTAAMAAGDVAAVIALLHPGDAHRRRKSRVSSGPRGERLGSARPLVLPARRYGAAAFTDGPALVARDVGQDTGPAVAGLDIPGDSAGVS